MIASRILVVDDDSTNLKLLKSLLTTEGYDCLCKRNGQEALDSVNEYKPDLMLIDVMMPLIDGFELTKQFKANESTKNIPIILITALTNRVSLLRGLDAGAEEFVSKPVDKTELLMRARNLLRLKEYSDMLTEHRAQLEEKVKARTEELYDTRLEIIRSLGRAAEYRDYESGLHVVRMSYFSKLLAIAIGLGEQKANLIFNASPMHDVGKVGIPDSILLRPGKLTVSEWEVMKTHTTIGFRILNSKKPNELIDLAKLIALYHHEKWDGTGYPERLRGDEIPIEARIVGLADAFDALTSKKPYRDAWTKEEAISGIISLKGQNFDPHLVEVFCDIMPQIDQIREEYSDNDSERKYQRSDELIKL